LGPPGVSQNRAVPPNTNTWLWLINMYSNTFYEGHVNNDLCIQKIIIIPALYHVMNVCINHDRLDLH